MRIRIYKIVGKRLGVAASMAALACSGSDKGSGTNGPTPVPGTTVEALEDASTRLLAGLPSDCLAQVTSTLTALRGKMSPTRTATVADISAVRSALGRCSDDASQADRDEIGLALDLAADLLRGSP